MFKEKLNSDPSTFNTIIRPITECETTKFTHNNPAHTNGYYLVKGLWGTAFHRIAHNKDRFAIVANNDPKCPHTYTKIPVALADKVFFVYINYRSGFRIIMPRGARVVGMHEAQAHQTGGWWSTTCLIYSPQGEIPTVEETSQVAPADQLRLLIGENEILFSIPALMKGFPIRYMSVDAEGWVDERCEAVRQLGQPVPLPPFIAATTDFGELLAAARSGRGDRSSPRRR